MLVIRPSRIDDLDALTELASMTSFGLTTLPKDRELLRKRLARASRGFQYEPDKPGGEDYLFVMEETDTGLVVGTSAAVSKVGGFEPFYSYRLETVTHESKMLNVSKQVQVLHLVTEHSGPSEIGSLFLRPSHRHSGHGRLLSLSRFLFIAEHPHGFEDEVIAELRGMCDETGRAPFWDALGRHFFDIEYPDADYLSVVSKSFIADLMPRHPVYVPLLPIAAQGVIGKVHPQTRPALRLLQLEGFDFCDLVDIFEAGPTVRCERDRIRSIRESRMATVSEIADSITGGEAMIVCPSGVSPAEFRACVGDVEPADEQSVRIDRDTASALGVEPGAPVRYVPPRSSE